MPDLPPQLILGIIAIVIWACVMASLYRTKDVIDRLIVELAEGEKLGEHKPCGFCHFIVKRRLKRYKVVIERMVGLVGIAGLAKVVLNSSGILTTTVPPSELYKEIEVGKDSIVLFGFAIVLFTLVRSDVMSVYRWLRGDSV